MWMIKNLFEKIIQYFTGGKQPKRSGRPSIKIGERNIVVRPQSSRPSEDAPRIEIRAVHGNSPIAEENVYRGEMDVANRNLGNGIVVNRRRKPGRCPICATKGRVIANTGSNGSWMCEECGSIFN